MGCDEIIILSKLSQSQKEKYCVFSITCGAGFGMGKDKELLREYAQSTLYTCMKINLWKSMK